MSLMAYRPSLVLPVALLCRRLLLASCASFAEMSVPSNTMRAMAIEKVSKIPSLSDDAEGPLVPTRMPIPTPSKDQVLVKVLACGVCHTELDEIEGRTAPPRLPVVPGHEVVGRITQVGEDVKDLEVGDRVGVGWIYDSDGSELENISPAFRATGRDVDGGYAEFLVVGQRYAYKIPDLFTDEQAAPLLCAGGVGYRALKLANLKNGQSLGLTGFGGSGHIVLQLAKHLFPQSKVYVFARSDETRQFALDLGADWAGNTDEKPPTLLDAIIDTTPAWAPIIAALAILKPGGRLIINAIRKESRDASLLAGIDYDHHLWMEKEIKTVANVTSKDLREFLKVAAEIPIIPKVTTYKLDDANVALRSLKAGNIQGAYVLKIGG